MENFIFMTINKDGKIIYKHNIQEINERLENFTNAQHIYLDGECFKEMGERVVNNTFTRVFVDNVKTFDKGANQKLKLHHLDELNYIVQMKEQYEPQTKIFFLGTPKFLDLVQKYVGSILVNVIDTEETSNDFVPQSIKETFNKRTDIKPQMYDELKKKQSEFRSEKEVIIADNGMRIVKEKSSPKQKSDLYYFYSFRK